MKRVILTVAVASVASVLQVAVSSPASAEISRVVVRDSGPMGTYGGREYTWVAADMEGTVARDDDTTGHYRVPISLNYPDRDANDFGFVDVVNATDFIYWADQVAPLGQRNISSSGNEIFGDFLRRKGFAYVSVQWSRMVTEQLGPSYGVIEAGPDGYEILRDSARLLRDLEGIEDQLPIAPISVHRVIAHGQSGAAGALRGMVWQGENRDGSGELVFDGFLLTGHRAENCAVLNNEEIPQDRPGYRSIPVYSQGGVPCVDLPDDGRMITIRTQTELENRVGQVSFDEALYRRAYDMAGGAHIPSFRRALRYAGASHQNPVSWQPVAKAMLLNLVDWIVAGTEPPRPLYFERVVDPDGVYRLNVDEDGNVLGGIRLPHMPSVLSNGDRAGAPLGVYGGFDSSLRAEDGYGYARLGGTFEPFTPEELARRYPTREAYVDLVRKAADALLADGYILEEDRDAYIRTAEHQPLAPAPIDPNAVITRVETDRD